MISYICQRFEEQERRANIITEPRGLELELGKLSKTNLLERHKEAVKYILSKREPNAKIINKVLLFIPEIKDSDIDLCK
jgi:hypothetical protein